MEPLTGRIPRDQNRVPILAAVSTTDGLTTVPLEANPATGALLVETSTAGGAVVTGNKTNNNAAPGATNLGVLPGIANAAVQTWTEGDQVLESMDLSGNQRGTLGTLISGEDQTFNRLSVQENYSFTNISTQTTTTVKSGAGRVKRIVIPTPTASATIKIYDNTAGSGTVICDTITFPATLLNDGPMVVELGATFSTGLTVVTAGATTSVGVYYI